MSIPLKLYFTCWFLGASVQSAVFFSFNAVDYFNYFFPDDYRPEVYIGVTVGVGASAGAILTVTFQPKTTHLSVLLITQTISAVLLVAEVVITPLGSDILSNHVRFGVVLAVIFVATVVQNIGGGALYSFVGKHFPTFGIHAAQSGGVCAFAATFVIRCVSKGSFEHLKDRRRGFRLSGYLFVALVDLIILVACCLIAVLRNFNRKEYARRMNTPVNRAGEIGENTPLLSSVESNVILSRRNVIRKNLSALLTVSLTLVISNALFPGITSQFHGDYNCNSTSHHSPNSSTIHVYSESVTSTTEPTTTEIPPSDKTGWFIVILFGCYSVADAIGKNLPILGIIYNKSTVIFNCLIQLVIAVPILLIYFEPCVSGLQADWVAYLAVGLLGLVNGYGLCAAMMLLAPGDRKNKQEEGMATSIGYMFLQVGILCGMSVSLFLVDYVFEITNN